MSMLWASSLTFLALHLFSAQLRLRDLVTGAIGETPYIVLFSLVSAATLLWMELAYNAAVASPANHVLFNLGPGLKYVGGPIVLFAFLLGVPGLLLRRSPTRIGYQNTAPGSNAPGILAITRHPFLWGFAIWSGFHIAAGGDEASLIMFGSLFLLSIGGTFSIDAKRRRRLGADWDNFAAQTSNLPFAAIVAGRARLNWREILTWHEAMALLLFLLFLFGHEHLFGASPFPTGWNPF